MPVDGSSLTTSWFGSGWRSRSAKPSRGGVLEDSRSSVCVAGRRLPVRMKNGTPDQRQLSMSSRSAAYVSVVESAATPSIVAVAVVLAAHVVRRVGGDDRAEERDLRVLERLRVAAGRRLHRGRRDDLHQVVDDDVAQRADRVVEVPAVLDAEVLGHRDLHGLDVVPVPDRLEHRVREAEVEDLLEPHLPEVVVDPEQLRLVDVLVQLVGERARRRRVVAERLLDDDPAPSSSGRRRSGP